MYTLYIYISYTLYKKILVPETKTDSLKLHMFFLFFLFYRLEHFYFRCNNIFQNVPAKIKLEDLPK